MRTLVLGLGNEFAGDDAAGLLVARAVREELDGEVDVVESSASGFALIELFDGYDRALVIDSILTGRDPPGTITEFALAELGPVVAPSTHQAGLPELAAVAARLGLDFPNAVRVLAVEVVDPYTFGAPVSEPVAAAIGEATRRALAQLQLWAEEEACTTTTR